MEAGGQCGLQRAGIKRTCDRHQIDLFACRSIKQTGEASDWLVRGVRLTSGACGHHHHHQHHHPLHQLST